MIAVKILMIILFKLLQDQKIQMPLCVTSRGNSKAFALPKC